MTKYAKDTQVAASKSRDEIERTLARYGADAFGYMTESTRAVIAFRMKGRQIKFLLPLPDPAAKEFVYINAGARGQQVRSATSKAAAVEQATRQRWRALLLIIKAKLEAVEAGITTVQDEFLAQTVLPDGSTVGQWAEPELKRVYELGHMPKTLMIGGPG